MELGYFMARLRHNLDVIRTLLGGVDPEQARWKPTPQQWSILEILAHLVDEEREDFPARIAATLEGRTWSGIDPEGWVRERHYNSQDLQETLQGFVKEREKSLSWLESLKDPDWETAHEHPRGKLKAGDLLASWLAHDYLHIRQLTQRHFQHGVEGSKPYSTEYAGSW